MLMLIFYLKTVPMYMYSIVFVAASTDSTNNKRDNEDYAELHDTRLN